MDMILSKTEDDFQQPTSHAAMWGIQQIERDKEGAYIRLNKHVYRLIQVQSISLEVSQTCLILWWCDAQVLGSTVAWLGSLADVKGRVWKGVEGWSVYNVFTTTFDRLERFVLNHGGHSRWRHRFLNSSVSKYRWSAWWQSDLRAPLMT